MMIGKDQGCPQIPPPSTSENINHLNSLAEKGIVIRGNAEYMISSTSINSVRILKHNKIKLHFIDC
jgi:hypothetical protein